MKKLNLEIPNALFEQLTQYEELSNIAGDQLIIMALSAFLKADALKFVKNDREQKIEQSLYEARMAELERRKGDIGRVSANPSVKTNPSSKNNPKMGAPAKVMEISDGVELPLAENVAMLTDAIPPNL